jgi:hypothetical protein
MKPNKTIFLIISVFALIAVAGYGTHATDDGDLGDGRSLAGRREVGHRPIGSLGSVGGGGRLLPGRSSPELALANPSAPGSGAGRRGR